jgi:type II secretory ATPase GspE/PulE/Tfp pilus assembly ATPase PilB-like protein
MESPSQIFEAVGCDSCRGSGFHGRVGVFEAVHFDDALASAIADHASEAEIRCLIEARTISLVADSLGKVRDGITSFQEARSIRWL